MTLTPAGPVRTQSHTEKSWKQAHYYKHSLLSTTWSQWREKWCAAIYVSIDLVNSYSLPVSNDSCWQVGKNTDFISLTGYFTTLCLPGQLWILKIHITMQTSNSQLSLPSKYFLTTYYTSSTPLIAGNTQMKKISPLLSYFCSGEKLITIFPPQKNIYWVVF